jgi:hypothetical protein
MNNVLHYGVWIFAISYITIAISLINAEKEIESQFKYKITGELIGHPIFVNEYKLTEGCIDIGNIICGDFKIIKQ